ncbi:MAG: TadE family protein [Pirellulales bacterium]
MSRTGSSPNHVSRRRGVATLEFVMALPLLFVLMICIMWEGFWLIGQAEVLITARNDAWKKRFDNAADSPLMFPVLDDPVPLGLYHANQDYVTEKASTTVDITPAFNRIPGPESSHTILAGSWDHEAMPLNKPPDFILMGKAAILGGFGSVLDLASATSDPLGLVEKFTGARRESERIDRSTKDEAEQAKNQGGSGGSGNGSGSGAGGSGDGKSAEQAQKESEEELERQKVAARKRFVELGGTVSFGDDIVVRPVNGELDAAQDAVIAAQNESKLKSEQARGAGDDETKKKLQEEAARANRKYELAKITYARLEAECKSVTVEAEGLGIERFELNFLVSRGF